DGVGRTQRGPAPHARQSAPPIGGEARRIAAASAIRVAEVPERRPSQRDGVAEYQLQRVEQPMRGGYAARLAAYGRGGLPCLRCGATLRATHALEGRQTVWGPVCLR
ncbi:MAG: hypothetical protein ACKOFO_05545, partial [Gemmatimonadota bacterium]